MSHRLDKIRMTIPAEYGNFPMTEIIEKYIRIFDANANFDGMSSEHISGNNSHLLAVKSRARHSKGRISVS